MIAPRYAIGIQSFEKLHEYDYTYVDKTQFIAKLIDQPAYYFLSRPRRFGKSLFLSTLSCFFEGKRELFKGLAIDSMDVDWTPRPVFYIDFNGENYNQLEGLDYRLDFILTEYEKKYGINFEGSRKDYSSRLITLLQTSYEQTGMKPVVLVDEYDKPLLGIEEKEEIFEKNQSILKGFFGVLKTLDKSIHFAMLTGVARFNKVSIFSDLNHLNDISLNSDYAAICGLTESELENTYGEGIEILAESLDVSYSEALTRMREYYDGYRFTVRDLKVYNPFSVILALSNKSLDPYWFSTGTPTFLAKRILRTGIDFDAINRQWCNREVLIEVGMRSENPIPLMFQTGYLTISDVEGQDYELSFPNFEVEWGFANQLMKLYVPQLTTGNPEFGIRQFKLDLRAGDVDGFMERMNTLLKDVSYEGRGEHLFRNTVYLIFTLMEFRAVVERHSSRGRCDFEVHVGDFIYIFEFKFNGTPEEAMAQIHNRDYAGRFRLTDKKVYLVGAAFREHTDEDAPGTPEVHWIKERLR